MKKPKSIGRAALDAVLGGAMQSSPLGTLSLFIAQTSDASHTVAKSFDVLTLASPPLPALGRDEHARVRIGAAASQRQLRGTTRVDHDEVATSPAVDDSSRKQDSKPSR